MADIQATLDGVQINQSITMHVKIHRQQEARLRLYIGRKLLLLAARVMNCNIEIEGTHA
jgi:hypothetical protein